uniref:Uncharacterized protein n=1 Tax=Steinernema glaseri TaxID=37863 RepID=A0A1I7ZZ03_9BILA
MDFPLRSPVLEISFPRFHFRNSVFHSLRSLEAVLEWANARRFESRTLKKDASEHSSRDVGVLLVPSPRPPLRGHLRLSIKVSRAIVVVVIAISMNSMRIWKSVFFVCLAVNFLLALLLCAVLGLSFLSAEKPPASIVICFAAFILLYFVVLGAYYLHARWQTRTTLVLSIAFSIGQLLALLVAEFLLLSPDASVEEEATLSTRPLTWIEQRPYIPIFFGAIFLPVLFCQLLMFHRFSCGPRSRLPVLQGDHRRKSTPYHGEKIYISKLGQAV